MRARGGGARSAVLAVLLGAAASASEPSQLDLVQGRLDLLSPVEREGKLHLRVDAAWPDLLKTLSPAQVAALQERYHIPPQYVAAGATDAPAPAVPSAPSTLPSGGSVPAAPEPPAGKNAGGVPPRGAAAPGGPDAAGAGRPGVGAGAPGEGRAAGSSRFSSLRGRMKELGNKAGGLFGPEKAGTGLPEPGGAGGRPGPPTDRGGPERSPRAEKGSASGPTEAPAPGASAPAPRHGWHPPGQLEGLAGDAHRLRQRGVTADMPARFYRGYSALPDPGAARDGPSRAAEEPQSVRHPPAGPEEGPDDAPLSPEELAELAELRSILDEAARLGEFDSAAMAEAAGRLSGGDGGLYAKVRGRIAALLESAGGPMSPSVRAEVLAFARQLGLAWSEEDVERFEAGLRRAARAAPPPPARADEEGWRAWLARQWRRLKRWAAAWLSSS